MELVQAEMTTKAFPFTWLPGWFIPHESTWSLAARIAVANHVPTRQVHEELFAPLGLSPYSWLIGGEEGSQWLADLLGLQKSLANTAFLDDLIEPGVDDKLRAKHLRYCPECLKQHFHSALFQFSLLEKCPIHRLPLQDSCPHCGTTNHRQALDVAPETRCPKCEMAFIPDERNWREVVNTKVNSLPLTKARKRLAARKDKGYIQSGAPQIRDTDNGDAHSSCSVEGANIRIGRMTNILASARNVRTFVASDSRPRIEMNEFMAHKLVEGGLRPDDVWAAMDACRNALYGLYSQLPDRHVDKFKLEYSAAFVDTSFFTPPLGSPAVAAYRLVEEFLGLSAPPNKGWELPQLSPRRFNKDFFVEHLDTSDHLQRLPTSVGVGMAALIVQSLYVDALEYVLDGRPDRPWTLWAREPDSFNYPVRWFGLATGKPGYNYQITAVTLATKARLQELLASF